jgi:hypothetical protein
LRDYWKNSSEACAVARFQKRFDNDLILRIFLNFAVYKEHKLLMRNSKRKQQDNIKTDTKETGYKFEIWYMGHWCAVVNVVMNV